jgi:hypothetical protein
MKQFFLTRYFGPGDNGSTGDTLPSRLVVKLTNESQLKTNDSISLEQLSVSSDEPLLFEKEFSAEDSSALNELAATASANKSDYQAPDFSTVYFAVMDPSKDYSEMIRQLLENPEVEFAFEDGFPAPAAVDASDDPMAIFQEYESASPVGVASFKAWEKNVTGSGIQVIDIETEWDLDHEDLPSGIPLLIGDNTINLSNNADHGTCVLGIICGQDNDKGIVGLAPDVTMQVASIIFPPSFSVARALTKAILCSAAGDIILLEQQSKEFLPVETSPLIFLLIELATACDIIIIEPAANASKNLDNVQVNGKNFMNRNSPDFRDSGAIMVGASTGVDPQPKNAATNFGSRVDCFAPGENVTTTGKNNQYIRNFKNTSAASAIITGVAALVQEYSATNGARLTPAEMRVLLSDDTKGLRSADIGVMPDLGKIIL